MRKIVMLLSNPFRPDVRVWKELTSLAKLGFHLSLVCWDRAQDHAPYERLAENIHVYRIQNVPSGYGIGYRQAFRLPQFWLAAQPYLRSIQPDLVHCHDFDTLPVGLLWAKTHRIPIIYDAHDDYAGMTLPRLPGWAGKLIYRLIIITDRMGARFASAVITVDENLAHRYQRFNRNVLIIGHYPEKSLARSVNTVFSGEHITMIYAGRLSQDRGLLLYVDVLRSLLAMGVPAQLVYAGVFTPPGGEQILREYSHDLQRHIEVRGWIPYEQIPQTLRTADLGLAILSPEKRYVDAIPVKVFEYMACGLPVIASDFPLVESIVKGSDCGVLVDPSSDPDKIAMSIKSLWDNPRLAQRLGENGRQAILSKYHWERYEIQMDQLYRSLLSD